MPRKAHFPGNPWYSIRTIREQVAMKLKKLFSYLIPYTCILCGIKSNCLQDLCKGCYRDLPFYPVQDSGALLTYDGPAPDLILSIKFQHNLSAARVLGELLAEKCQQFYKKNPHPLAIIPIPLHRDRLKERGFNQALEIARPVAARLGIPLQTKKIHRIKPTLAQATLPQSKRQSNVSKAFSVQTTYQHVAVIDDVYTTGNTMEEFCRTLTMAGVKKIDTWVVARPVFSTVKD